MRAVVVLPTPRTPVRIQACGMRPDSNAFEMVRTMASWPIRSAKVDGRYLRASTRYGADGVAASFIATGVTSFPGPTPTLPLSGGGSKWSAISFLPLKGGGIRWGSVAMTAHRAIKSSAGWEADERPEPRSLGLLPSGPDPVGEWLAHRQPPGLYIGRGGGESKLARGPCVPCPLRQLPPGVVVIEPPGLEHGLVAAEALAPGIAQVAAQPRQRRRKVIVARAGARTEHGLACA